ncbi:unnamed protein product [Peronospora belbahrii]|uniref:Uncharacterized protein n=1 Tax=Peronospora belbahrii TaxID=622444 RepID=A0AAU9LBC2_9STRA|nr:unnamed protein product [Peronospora belbahrii]
MFIDDGTVLSSSFVSVATPSCTPSHFLIWIGEDGVLIDLGGISMKMHPDKPGYAVAKYGSKVEYVEPAVRTRDFRATKMSYATDVIYGDCEIGVVGTLTRDYVGRSVDKIDEADMEKMMENRFVSYGDVSIGHKGYINDSFLKIMSGNDSVSTKTMTGKLQCGGLAPLDGLSIVRQRAL